MFLSFIIPVYNTGAYLEACLDSLLGQQFPAEEYEIVCVNDGSTDESPAIVHRYADRFDRVKVVDQPNGGVCRARNAGFVVAEGQYLWYIDADDVIAPDALAAVYREVQKSGCERLILGNYEFTDETPGDRSRTNTGYANTVVWRNVFRREFLVRNDLTFKYPELTFGEDALFLYECFRLSPVTAQIPDILYGHRVRAGSLSTDMNEKTIRKRLESNLVEAQVLQRYHEQEHLMPAQTADRLMWFLWGTMMSLAELPRAQARPYLKKLKGTGLYPYRLPEECTLRKVEFTDGGNWKGRLYNAMCFRCQTRLGYHGLRLWNAIGRLRRKQ